MTKGVRHPTTDQLKTALHLAPHFSEWVARYQNQGIPEKKAVGIVEDKYLKSYQKFQTRGK